MIEKAKIVELANECLHETDRYVVDLQIKAGNVITIIIDGDTPLAIVDCVKLSKFIESKLDREVEDFDLKVSSFGAEKPFKLKRQYRKNIGRDVEVLLDDDKTIICNLLEVNDEMIKIRPIEKKKKNQAPTDDFLISFSKIKQTKCIISFN